jgi:Glu-tRNA(Gln) amidotransferase subunit E-like FAD-binding protein
MSQGKTKSRQELLDELTKLSTEAARIERDLPNYAICKREFSYIMEHELIDADRQLEALVCYSGIDDKVQELKITLQKIQNRLTEIVKEIPESTGGKWSKKYKKSINCKKPKGFSQKQHCRHGRKTRRRRKKN